MKKRLLIGTDSLLPRWDGVARALDEIIPLLSEKYEITLLGPRCKGQLPSYKGVNMVLFPVSKMMLGDYNPAFPSLKKVNDAVNKADLVFTQTLGPIGFATLISASLQKKPLFAYTHSIEWELFSKASALKGIFRNIVYSASKIYARFAYNRCTMLFVPSAEIGEFFSLEGIKTQKKVIRMGVNLDTFRPAENAHDAKEKQGLSGNLFVIGYSGRIAREKDLMTLYRSFVRFRKKHPHSRLLIVGEGLLEIKKRLLKDPSVLITGHTQRMPDWLQAMDIYVLPSLTETSSISTMEAMACGVPVVCTPVGALKTYVRNGHNGLFFARKHPVMLNHRLEFLFNHPDKRAEMGRNARKTALTNFSWQKSAKEFEEVFDLF